MKNLFNKTGFIAVVILICIFSSQQLIFAQQADEKTDPLIIMREKAAAQIKELQERKELSPEELKALQDLEKSKAEIDQKIQELKIDLPDKRVDPATKTIEAIKEKVRKIDAANKEASLKEIAAEEERLSKRVKETAAAKEEEQSANQARKEAYLKATAAREESELNNRCLMCKAVAVGSVEPCAEIQDENWRRHCRNLSLGIKLFFNELDKTKQVTKAALELCRESLDYDASRGANDKCRLICESYLKGDFTAVVKLAQGEIDPRGLAFLSGDAKYCTYGSDEQGKQEACLRNAYFTSAIKSGNKELCSRINDAAAKATCQAYFEKNDKKCEEFRKAELLKQKKGGKNLESKE